MLSSDIKLLPHECAHPGRILRKDVEDVIGDIGDQTDEEETIELDGYLPVRSWDQEGAEVVVEKVPV